MKILKFLKRDIAIFLLGAIFFGSIGTVVATNIASSSIGYTTSKMLKQLKMH